MNCYEQLWTGLKSYEQLWTVSNSYEQLWTIMNSYEQLLKDINRYSQNISNLKDKFDVASYIGWHLSISESRFFRTLMSKNLRGGAIILLFRKLAIAPEPNVSNLAVNSSLSVV